MFSLSTHLIHFQHVFDHFLCMVHLFPKKQKRKTACSVLSVVILLLSDSWHCSLFLCSLKQACVHRLCSNSSSFQVIFKHLRNSGTCTVGNFGHLLENQECNAETFMISKHSTSNSFSINKRENNSISRNSNFSNPKLACELILRETSVTSLRKMAETQRKKKICC